MPFNTNDDLPENVRQALPIHAQDIYKEVFNSAWKEYKDPAERRDDASREETAHRVAWSAVKQKYGKRADGIWQPRAQ